MYFSLHDFFLLLIKTPCLPNTGKLLSQRPHTYEVSEFIESRVAVYAANLLLPRLSPTMAFLLAMPDVAL